MDQFYITTAINYTNGPPHIGHCYEAILADCIARYQRLCGKKVFFMTGTDEHGLKIAKTAEANRVKPIEICDKYAKIFQDRADNLGISYDFFIRTTMTSHETIVRDFYGKMKENGDIYLGEYIGWYNVREETYVSETDAIKTNYKDPMTGKDLTRVKESSYFFRLSKYQKEIHTYLSKEGNVVPDSRRLEMLKRLDEPLKDLSISRTSFTWGIPVPHDPDHCLYVWVEALMNYYTGAVTMKYGEKPWWPADVHVIGKDITWFHSVIWIGMLLSAKLPLPKQILVHNFITASDGQKMSKTLGNTVNLDSLLKSVPVDTFRYYLLKKSSLTMDLRFSDEEMKIAHNCELADGLGNLAHRVLAMIKRYYKCRIPTKVESHNVFDYLDTYNTVVKYVNAFNFGQLCVYLNEKMHTINQYINQEEPWKQTVKDETRAVVIFSAFEALYLITRCWIPIQPSIGKELLNRMGQTEDIDALYAITNGLKGEVHPGPPLYQKYD